MNIDKNCLVTKLKCQTKHLNKFECVPQCDINTYSQMKTPDVTRTLAKHCKEKCFDISIAIFFILIHYLI